MESGVLPFANEFVKEFDELTGTLRARLEKRLAILDCLSAGEIIEVADSWIRSDPGSGCCWFRVYMPSSGDGDALVILRVAPPVYGTGFVLLSCIAAEPGRTGGPRAEEYEEARRRWLAWLAEMSRR